MLSIPRGLIQLAGERYSENSNKHVAFVMKVNRNLFVACNFTKNNTPSLVFSRFLNCANGTKARNAPHIMIKFSNFKSVNRAILTLEITIRNYLYFPICCAVL